MKQLCKDLHIDFNMDYTTRERKTDIILENRGVVVQTLRKTDPIAIRYMHRTYSTISADIVANFIENLGDLYPEVLARCAAIIGSGGSAIDVQQYLTHYDPSDVEANTFESHVRALLANTSKLII